MRSSHSRSVSLAEVSLAILVSLLGANRPARAELTFELVKEFEQPAYRTNSLIPGRDGALYGTSVPGPSNAGTVFRIDAAGTFATLRMFSWAGGESEPVLYQEADGSLYGTTRSSYEAGTLFKVDDSSVFTTLYEFDSGGPPRSLTPGNDGALYGVTSSTVFKVDEMGTVTSLHSFAGQYNYGTALSALTLGSDGALYGILQASYTSRASIFRIDAAGTVTFLHEFDTCVDCERNALTLGRDGALYGIMRSFIFRIDTAGGFSTLYSFGGENGYPVSDAELTLTLGNDGALYGTTPGTFSGPSGGTVFRIDGAGTFTTVHSFTSSYPEVSEDGAFPGNTRLTLGRDGALYGITSRGGQTDRGTVFRIDSAGNFSTLHSFDEVDEVDETV
ncbi:MAG: choice-of-anchor tandem repeat GloVer-containing protein, partial [Thermomicrobiales bacterium]